MHCFFHLVNANDIIVDNTGVDVADLTTARSLALEAIEDLKRENPGDSDDWEGWSLAITDVAGRVLSSISLDPATEFRARPRRRQLAS
ncbi:DUF6894 family protein [Microvirga makkahensis]|uniref:DUF6894 family protein n=1 Tax=Microvirga makkahensis TaxID=1128670 RepID=UPI003CCCA847